MPRSLNTFIDGTAVSWVDPETLVPADENPRRPLKLSDPARYDELKASIEKGSFKPLLVEKGTNEIIDGHQSREVYIDLGRQCPILYIRKLTRAEKIRIRATANTHAGYWDIPALKTQLAELPHTDVPLLSLDAPILDLVLPQPAPTQPDEADNQAFGTLKEKMTKEDYEFVDAVIRRVQKENGGTRGKTIANVFHDWILDPQNAQYAPHS